MPGVLIHLITGSAIFFVGKLYFKKYFSDDYKKKKHLLLAFVCILFSLIPDFFLGIYYSTHILSFEFLVPYHFFAHLIFSPIAIVLLLILKYWIDVKREPIWITGLWCLLLHIIMDLFIPEIGWLI